MSETPIEHIMRERVPWATFDVTECGRAPSEFSVVITQDAAKEKIKSQGRQRAAFTTCMTCWETANRWSGSWRSGPRWGVERHLSVGKALRPRVEAELTALGLLVQAHREEYDTAVEGLLNGTESLADKRSERAYARTHRGLPS